MERQVEKLTVDLTWMTWNEGIEMKNWNEGLEMNDFTGMNWNEAIAKSCVRFLSEIELWLQSRAHFVKFFEAVSFKGFYVINYLMTMWLTHETELSLQGLRAWGCLQARIHVFPICYTSQLLEWCVWHDDWVEDAVAMMVRQLAMTIVRNSEVS